MRKKIKIIIAALASTLAVPLAAQSVERSFTLLERQQAHLIDIMPGQYDNLEQLVLDPPTGDTDRADNSSNRTYSKISEVKVPALGDQVLMVEDYRSNDRKTPYRRRLYSVSPDEKAGALRAEQYPIQKGVDPAKVAKGAKLKGCDLLIRRKGDFFEGTLENLSCDSDEKDYAFRVWEDQLWTKASNVAAGSWRQMEKARSFACMIDFPPKPGAFPGVTHHYITIHDQGGEFSFVHPDGRPMTLFMRNFWSEEMFRETFVIGILDKDYTGEILTYAWAEPGAKWIGVNPLFVRVQCDLDTPLNRRLQQELRPDS